MEALLIIVAIQTGSAVVGGLVGSLVTGIFNKRMQRRNREKIQADIKELKTTLQKENTVSTNEPMEMPTPASIYNEPYQYKDLRVK